MYVFLSLSRYLSANTSQGNQIGAAFWYAVLERDEPPCTPPNSIIGKLSLANMALMALECMYITHRALGIALTVSATMAPPTSSSSG